MDWIASDLAERADTEWLILLLLFPVICAVIGYLSLIHI